MGCLKNLHFYCAICVTPSSCWYYWMSILWLCWYYCLYCGISMNSSGYAVWTLYCSARLFLFACPFLCPLSFAETEWGVSFVSTLHLRECACVLRGVGERETARTHWKKEMSDWTKHGHHFTDGREYSQQTVTVFLSSNLWWMDIYSVYLQKFHLLNFTNRNPDGWVWLEQKGS